MRKITKPLLHFDENKWIGVTFDDNFLKVPSRSCEDNNYYP